MNKIERKIKPILSLIIIIPTLILFTECKNKKEQNINEIILMGKERLKESDFQGAVQIFSEGIKKEPNNPEVRFGMALSLTGLLLKNIQDVVTELGNAIVQLISGFSPPSKHISPNQNEIPTETTINTILDDILQANIIYISEKIIENLEIPRKEKNWNFKVDKLSWRVEFQGKEIWRLDLDGIEFDNADANLLYGTLKAAQGFIKLILSIDLDLKLENIVRTYSFIQELGGISGISVRDVIMRIIPFLLNERENLLGIEPTKGKIYWKQVPELFISSSEAFIQMLDSIEQETDAQEDDFIAPADENTFAIPTSSDSIFKDEELSDKFGERPRSKLEIPPSLKDDLSQISKSFQGKERVSWAIVNKCSSNIWYRNCQNWDI
jgi:hypothetical protein